MADSLPKLARRIENQPWNRPGTDMSWVLAAIWQHLRFLHEVRQANRVDAP